MTITDAATQGITRVRLPEWVYPNAYVKLDLLGDGRLGPWGHLWSRDEQGAIGAETPQDFLLMGETSVRWEAYAGPIDPEDQ